MYIAAETRYFIRGCIVATFVFVTYMSAGLLFRYVFGMPAAIAAIAAVLVAAAVSYFGHSYFTFQVSSRNWSYVTRFAALLLLTIVVNWCVMTVVPSAVNFPYWLRMIVATTLVPMLNYVMLRLFVFAAGLKVSLHK